MLQENRTCSFFLLTSHFCSCLTCFISSFFLFIFHIFSVFVLVFSLFRALTWSLVLEELEAATSASSDVVAVAAVAGQPRDRDGR
jgi:hypothetical protein